MNTNKHEFLPQRTQRFFNHKEQKDTFKFLTLMSLAPFASLALKYLCPLVSIRGSLLRERI